MCTVFTVTSTVFVCFSGIESLCVIFYCSQCWDAFLCHFQPVFLPHEASTFPDLAL